MRFLAVERIVAPHQAARICPGAADVSVVAARRMCGGSDSCVKKTILVFRAWELCNPSEPFRFCTKAFNFISVVSLTIQCFDVRFDGRRPKGRGF